MFPSLVFSIVAGDKIPPEALKVFEHNRNVCAAAGVQFAVFHYDIPEKYSSGGLFADEERVRILSVFSRCLYLDWDCKLLKVPELPHYPAFGKWQHNNKFDYFICWNADDIELFRLLYEENGCDAAQGSYFSHLNKNVERLQIQELEPEMYVHYNFNCAYQEKGKPLHAVRVGNNVESASITDNTLKTICDPKMKTIHDPKMKRVE